MVTSIDKLFMAVEDYAGMFRLDVFIAPVLPERELFVFNSERMSGTSNSGRPN